MDNELFSFYGAVVPLNGDDDDLQVFEVSGSEVTLADLVSMNPELFRASKVETPRETVLPGYEPVTVTANVRGLEMSVTTLRWNPPTTRRGLTL